MSREGGGKNKRKRKEPLLKPFSRKVPFLSFFLCVRQGSCKPPSNAVPMSDSSAASDSSSPAVSVRSAVAPSAQKENGPTIPPATGPSPITPSVLAAHEGFQSQDVESAIGADATNAADPMVQSLSIFPVPCVMWWQHHVPIHPELERPSSSKDVQIT